MKYTLWFLSPCTLCMIIILAYCRYADFIEMFKAELFDADKWAYIFKKSGAQCK